ncbi:endoglucanase [Histoplasma capsulatum var. duboisii H88]|uniref:Endoglucanase n=1 Tax=Ajellomyces capsulatus (strain H88) TaxID=544711 RepID=A0A8A1LLL7_AJEC8|nr:endoglucanase [Histoplasma capsulatum var. duboisii H88]
MLSSAKILYLIGLATLAQAHMGLYHPPPFAAANNPHLTNAPDSYLDYPYNCCGRTTPFPCKGYLSHLSTPQGQSVASWAAGSQQNFSLTGTGNHYGGSCQVGFSVDKGATWKVVKSFEGNCPYRNGGTDPGKQTFEFTVPRDTPVGVQVFAWTWINREREFNMLCAAVEITGAEKKGGGQDFVSRSDSGHRNGRHRRDWGLSQGHQYSQRDTGSCTCTCGGGSSSDTSSNGASATTTPPAVPFNDRPSFLFANIDNGCQTPMTNFEVKYPNPGPDVVQGDGEYELKLPEPADKCN